MINYSVSQTSALKEVRVLFTRIRLLARVLACARVMARIKWIRLIYLFLNIGKTRNLSLKKQQISLVFCILCELASVSTDTLLVKLIVFRKLGLCTTRLKQTWGWIVTYVSSIIFTHIWLQNMLRSLNTVRVILLCFYHSFYFF